MQFNGDLSPHGAPLASYLQYVAVPILTHNSPRIWRNSAFRGSMPPMQGRSLVIEDVRDPQGESHILRLNGPLVLTTVDEFQSRVRAVRSNHLIIDMTDVPYVDSAGIGVLVGTYVRHQRDETGLSLVGVNDRVLMVLKIAHVDQFFRFFSKLDETAKLAS